MGHAPPVVRLALAFAAGVAWGLIGAPLLLAPLAALLLLLAPNDASRSPDLRPVWVACGLCGLAAARLATAGAACASAAGVGAGPVALEGRFLASPLGGSAPFRPLSACGDVTVVVPSAGGSQASASVSAGVPVRLEGHWRQGRVRPWFQATEAARLDAAPDEREWAWWPVRWRDHLVERLRRLYGERAPLVAALTLARREGLDRDLQESFARSGIAHLLAISGFHVGVIAGAVLTGLALCGVGARRRELGAAAAAWAYVALIGFPDAACRAALMLALVALSRARGRPPARWAPLGAALLTLVAVAPEKLASAGFQLSFAGAAGLVAWAGPLSRTIRRLSRRRCPEGLATALAAGLAATLATLPVVAWHFERVSLVGIPATLAATPLVSLALMGSLASLAIDFAWPALASFLAGGVALLLAGLEVVAEASAAPRWASAWTTRSSVIAGTCGLVLATRLALQPRIGARARRLLVGAYVASGVLAWPLLLALQGRGSMELLVIDVGQGDAIALRSPRGRWLLVDAGPSVRNGDANAHPAVRALRARGVGRLEALVLTHPDLDHIGGAAAVLSTLDVRAVYDPAIPAPKQDFVDVLDVAAARGVPWRAARAGGQIELDGLRLEILHPPDSIAADAESNATSVVLRLSYGEFDALLTGDAYTDVERALLPELAPLEVLKVGHHGSDTSTDSLLLAHTRPEVALISVGRTNRYGHPSPRVVERLERSGADVRRTDLEGTLSIVARKDGRYEVRGERR
ncbi:MAG TPA: DNA internalization-related competence protein ComEC/Rec2 [Longimicrobiales bacterium]|nr:DNA internalization-related competence protein ComEC/Rec2 [Longimicrobiales bacterium]